MVTWQAKVQGKALIELFEKGLADPKQSTADAIDAYWKLDKSFEKITMVRFRDNYRKVASKYMTAKGLQGVRKRDLEKAVESPDPKKEKKTVEESTEEAEEEPPPAQEPIEEVELIEETEEKKMTVQPSSNTAVYKYKDDEKKWMPFYQSYKFDAGGFHCEELIIEPPASFDGSDDKCQITLTDDNKVLVVKFAPNLVLSDPYHINGYKKHVHGFETVKESSRNNAAEAKQDQFAGKWYTFRYRLDWAGKPSTNMMGTMPWFAFTRIKLYEQRFPVVIINLSSIEPIKIRKPTVDVKLSRVGMDYDGTPTKGVDMDSPNAQMATMLEGMFKRGFTLEEIAKRLNGDKPDSSGSHMDVETEEERERKRVRNLLNKNDISDNRTVA